MNLKSDTDSSTPMTNNEYKLYMYIYTYTHT